MNHAIHHPIDITAKGITIGVGEADLIDPAIAIEVHQLSPVIKRAGIAIGEELKPTTHSPIGTGVPFQIGVHQQAIAGEIHHQAHLVARIGIATIG